MASDQEVSSASEAPGGRIEGGIDAVVIGACADGLAAAAYLGKAGLTTVLLEEGAEIGGPVRAREFGPEFSGIDGEHLVTVLDPEVIAELDLYKHGVEYASRRLETMYFFEEGEPFLADSDPFLIPQSAEAANLEDAGVLRKLTDDVFEAASFLTPVFNGPNRQPLKQSGVDVLETAIAHAPPDIARRLARYAAASVDDVLGAAFSDGPIRDYLTAEASFRSAAAPHEPFSFMNLIRRWSGEASGLQGAIAYPKGGAVTIIDALRRAVQAAKVDIRTGAAVKSILIEWDGVAGVELVNGGQIRAPIVVNALDAKRAFLEKIGPGDLDIEFQRALSKRTPSIASARLHLALKGAPGDEDTALNMKRRLVFAPAVEGQRKAFIEARAGRVPEQVMVEAIFPAALEEDAAPGAGQILSVFAHPLPFDAEPDEKRREHIQNVIVASLEHIAPGIGGRIEASNLSLAVDLSKTSGADPAAYAAPPGIIRQWTRVRILSSASNIAGLFFCGPEAQIGVGLSCAAGRHAATAALSHYRRRGGA